MKARMRWVSTGMLGAAFASAASAQSTEIADLRGADCVGLVAYERLIDPLPAIGADGAITQLDGLADDKVLAVDSCGADDVTIRYAGAAYSVSRSLVRLRWLQTGDRLDGGELITADMRAKAVSIPREAVNVDLPRCDELASVSSSSDTRLYGAAGFSGGGSGERRCRED